MNEKQKLLEDIKAYQRSGRSYRLSNFIKTVLPALDDYNVTNPSYGKYTIITMEFGVIDIFPMADKLLLRRVNRWYSNAKDFIIRNIFKEFDNMDYKSDKS